MRKVYTPATAAVGVEEVLKLLEGRWKLTILFHLFDGKVQRYSDFEKLIPGISQKMLAQQLRQLEADGIVARKLYPQVPPKVEYRLTGWGQSLCPALDALLKWAEQRESLVNPAAVRNRPRLDSRINGTDAVSEPGVPLPPRTPRGSPR
jgi:DNA-binding HxlR family transcriptional regulator